MNAGLDVCNERPAKSCRCDDVERPRCPRHHAGDDFLKGNKNALKHGRYTAEAIASRRKVAAIIRMMRSLVGATTGSLGSGPAGAMVQ